MSNNDTLSILVLGDNAQGRAFVTNVINEALEDVGFVDVALVNTIGDPVDKEDSQTMLDLIKTTRPEFFDTPVVITSRPAPGSLEEDTTGSTELIGGEEDQDNELAQLADIALDPDGIAVY